MEIKNLLRLRKILCEKEELVIKEINDQITSMIYNSKKVEKYISLILDLLHDGLNVNKIKYLDKIFFDFHIIREKIKPHKERIYIQLENINLFKENSLEEQTHLVNIYRNIVSDLFDTYINLLVASLQFIKGDFIDIQHTDLGQSERNKYEYAISNIKSTNLFDGYNPIVRNAISHAGTNGIIYEQNAVVFRNIKRGSIPKIDMVKWTNNELKQNVLQLMDFVHAIDNSIEIFGFDVSEIIIEDKELSQKFHDEIISREQRLEIQSGFNSKINKIVNNNSIDKKKKLDILSNLFFGECEQRDILVKSVKFNENDKIVLLEVPLSKINTNIDNEIIDRSLILLRYGIIAVCFYKFYYKTYLVKEIKEEGKDTLSFKLNGTDLEEYGQEQISLYDLLNDNELYINNKRVKIEVDFDKLKELEYLGLERRYPIKKR